MKSTVSKDMKPPKRLKFVETIYVKASKLEAVPSGKYYAVFQKRDNAFIFNEKAEKVFLDRDLLEWEPLDHIVMIVRATSSNLDSIKQGSVYRVFDDVAHDERYIIDDSFEKVLFDENIFKWELV